MRAARVLSLLAVAAVIAVAAAAVVDSLRGDEEPARSAAAPPPGLDCLDREACRRGVRELVSFFRACVTSWNDPANGANRDAVAGGAFDAATLFRTGGERCSIHFASTASGRVLLGRRSDGRWSAVAGGRRPPAADDFRDAWDAVLRADGTLSLRGG